MRRLLTPPVVLLAGLALALTGCSGESPTAPTGAGGGSGSGTCTVTISLDATSVTPLAGSAVIVRATPKRAGAAVPDGTSVVLTTDYGYFVETGLPSISKVTSSGFADVTLAAGASGTSHVKATLDCGSATITIQFGAVPADGPYISSLSPLTGSCKGGDTVTINGGRLMTSLNVQPRVTFGGSQATILSASATGISVLTPSRTLADASVPETVDVVVTVNPGTSAIQVTAPKKFTYTCLDKRIAVSSVVPNIGRQEGNEPVVVSGANFGSNAATTRVTFGGSPASITGQNDGSINVVTPKHTLANASVPEVVDVAVTVDLGLPTQQSATLPRSFTYYATGPGTPCNSDPRLFITQIVLPSSSNNTGSPDGGEVVTINGGGFWFGNSSQPQPLSRVKVEFGGIQGQVTNWQDASITVVTPRRTLSNPDAPESVDIRVTVDVGGSREACVVSARSYTYFPGTYLDPYITSMSPSAGPNDASTRVTLFGKNFRFPEQVFVGSAEATVVSVTSSQIVFMTPTATGANSGMAGTTQPVSVRDTYSGKSATSPVSFHYYPCPSAGTAAPATAAWNVSTPVTISGNGFEEPVEAVFNANGASYRVNVISVSSSFIIVQMPVLDQLLGTGNIGCGDVAGSIQLTFPSLLCAGQIQVPFTYQINRPTISTVQPQGPIPQLGSGAAITVTGSGFVDPMTVDIVSTANGTTSTVSVRATVASSTVLTFTPPAIPDTAFIKEGCTVVAGNDGERLVSTWMLVRVRSERTGCTAQLPSILLYAPSDASCHLKNVSVSGNASNSAIICTPASFSFPIAGGSPPYTATAVSNPPFPPGLSATVTGSSVTIAGTPLFPSAASPNPGTATSTYTVVITAFDSSTPTSKSGTFTTGITVTDPRAPLNVSVPAAWNVGAGVSTLTPTALVGAVPAGFPVTWTATGLPAGVTINAGTGVLSATAAPNPPNGISSIVITATETTAACAGNAIHSATANVTLTVTGR